MRRHVLIVHRDAELRAALSQLLARDGYQVTAEGDGREGLGRARERHPDLIVLGVLAPHLSGREFREAQKRDPTIADIPVVVVSSLATEQWARLHGVAAVFPRPFDEAAFLGVVRELTGRAAVGGREPRDATQTQRRPAG
jgi:CheY-like chemotaxis protein